MRLEAQHDFDSCGVYCVAVAFDRMSEKYEFAEEDRVGKSASAQLRVRILWRLLHDSNRVDNECNPDVLDALHTLEGQAAIIRRKTRSRKCVA